MHHLVEIVRRNNAVGEAERQLAELHKRNAEANRRGQEKIAKLRQNERKEAA